MIEHIRAEGFKGFKLDEDVPMKVLYCGKNRTGKSTRAAAIALVLYGHIPFSLSGKRPSDIMDSYCSGDSLIVAVKINGIEFARKFSRTDKGSATQSLQVNKKKKNAQDFAVELQKAGAPKIANVAEFMAQSEQKKIDTLFDLFPVDGDLNALDSKIEKAKAEVSRIKEKKDNTVAVAKRLTESKNNTMLPSGTLAEVKKEIEDIDIQIKDFSEQIKQAEIKEAEEKAKKDAEKKILDDQEKERERKKKEDLAKLEKKPEEIVVVPNESTAKSHSSGGHAFIDGEYPEVNDRFRSGSVGSKSQKFIEECRDNPSQIDQEEGDGYINHEGVISQAENIHNPTDSIQRIIGALENAGCSVCAAMIVAKQEIKKYQRSN